MIDERIRAWDRWVRVLLVVVVVVWGIVWSHGVSAQTTYVWQCSVGGSTDISACANAETPYPGNATNVTDQGTCGIPPDPAVIAANGGGSSSCTFKYSVLNSDGSCYTGCGGFNGGMTSAAGAPNACSALAGKVYDMEIPGSAAGAAGASMCGSDGCGYSLGPQSTFRQYSVGSMHNSQSATATGRSCTAGSGAQPGVGSQLDSGTGVSDCTAQGTNVACTVQSGNGTYCGTYNGDYVCLGQVAAGTCVAYSSGGVACTVNAAHPSAAGAPDNGTAGQAATPTGVLTDPTGNTTNYYTPGQVAGSHGGATTQGSGTSGTNNGSTVAGTTGTGTGTGTSGTGAGNSGDGTCVPSAETACGDSFAGGNDCSAPPACTGDAVQCGQATQVWHLMCPASSGEADIASAIGTVDSPAASSVDLSNILSEAQVGDGSWGAFTTSADTTCPAPIPLSIMGRTVNFDLWKWPCQFGSGLAFITMTLAYIVAGRVFLTASISNSL